MVKQEPPAFCANASVSLCVLAALCAQMTFLLGFSGGTSGKESTCQCRRHKGCAFDPWVGKIPWRRAWQPTLVFLPGESPWTEEPDGLQSMGLQSQTGLKQLSTYACPSFCFPSTLRLESPQPTTSHPGHSWSLSSHYGPQRHCQAQFLTHNKDGVTQGLVKPHLCLLSKAHGNRNTHRMSWCYG